MLGTKMGEGSPVPCAPLPQIARLVLWGTGLSPHWGVGALFYYLHFPVQPKAGLGSLMLQLLAAAVMKMGWGGERNLLPQGPSLPPP